MKRLALCVLITACISVVAVADNSHKSKYVGEENRMIKSLSNEDIDELRRGGGWGMAKAAELNGVPGPKHILEMSEEIDLTEDQRDKMEQLFDEMQTEAIKLGSRLTELESDLNRKFASREISEEELKKIVSEIGQVTSELRIVHLATHLKTPEILSKAQIARYNQLRGYEEDPCANIPDGHDPEMWKKHNSRE